jgi:transcriptional regulator with XRE-family HTH domain
VLLDTEVIAERRLQLGLSTLGLARAIGRSPTTISSLERGENDLELTLGDLVRLAEALAAQPWELFVPSQRPQPGADDLRIEAALALLAKATSAEDLADGLQWDLVRVHAALHALRRRLAVGGVRLQRNAGRYRLVPATGLLSNAEVRRLEQASVATSRVARHEARVLLAAVRGLTDARWLQNASNADRVAAARLTRLGWVTTSAGGLRPTTALTSSLGLQRDARGVRDSERCRPSELTGTAPED